MNQNYKIEINITPSKYENKSQPYHWILFAYYDDWCNEGAGWATTPELAWSEAYNFFVRYKKQK